MDVLKARSRCEQLLFGLFQLIPDSSTPLRCGRGANAGRRFAHLFVDAVEVSLVLRQLSFDHFDGFGHFALLEFGGKFFGFSGIEIRKVNGTLRRRGHDRESEHFRLAGADNFDVFSEFVRLQWRLCGFGDVLHQIGRLEHVRKAFLSQWTRFIKLHRGSRIQPHDLDRRDVASLEELLAEEIAH